MANISENTTGVNFTEVITPGTVPPHKPRFRTGTTVKGDDGERYQYVKANATIASGNTTVNVTVSNGEYVAANSGGTAANASGQSVSSGQYFWVKL